MLFDSLSQIAFILLFSIQSLKWYSATILIIFADLFVLIICTALFFVFLKVEVRLQDCQMELERCRTDLRNNTAMFWEPTNSLCLFPESFFLFFWHSFRFLPLWLCTSVCLKDTRPWWSLIWMECVRDGEATGSNIMNVLSSQTLWVRKHWKACFYFTGAHSNLTMCGWSSKTVAIELWRTLCIHKM